MLDDQQVAAAVAAAAAEDTEGEEGGPLRHLTAAQRASMTVRTFNLRCGCVVLLWCLDGLLA